MKMLCRLSPVSSRQTRGFTLIEILVVIGIIAVLAALLFPVFRSARESVRRTTCQGNLKQIGVALQLYAADNNGRYPIVSSFGPSGNCTWVNRIESHLKSFQVLQCPAHPFGEFRPGCPDYEVTEQDTDGDGSNDIHYFRGSYALNQASSTQRRGLSDSAVRFPSNLIVVVDNTHTPPQNAVCDAGFTRLTSATNDEAPIEQCVADRHQGGVNVLFFDGHVKWLRMKDLKKRSLWRADGSDVLPPSATP